MNVRIEVRHAMNVIQRDLGALGQRLQLRTRQITVSILNRPEIVENQNALPLAWLIPVNDLMRFYYKRSADAVARVKGWVGRICRCPNSAPLDVQRKYGIHDGRSAVNVDGLTRDEARLVHEQKQHRLAHISPPADPPHRRPAALV